MCRTGIYPSCKCQEQKVRANYWQRDEVLIESTTSQQNIIFQDFGVYPIQPDHCRAPEVVLGCGWTSSRDIETLTWVPQEAQNRTKHCLPLQSCNT
jgi:hypothetical protein